MLWAITSYFNPVGYARRLQNYRRFRAALRVPLLTVELGYGAGHELGEDEATILLRCRGRDVMWQKERLLNLALAALPEECTEVAWLDCDLLFPDESWVASTRSALRRAPLAQLFCEAHYLPSAWQGDPACAGARLRPSVAAGVATGAPVREVLEHPGPERRPGTYTNGLAWAGRRDLLEEHGFFDACIVGGGDRAFACGAWGCFDHLFAWHRLNEAQREHYLAWAGPFHRACRGGIAALRGRVYHLWHGETRDRGFGARQAGLAAHGFDPSRDIAVDAGGCWRWSSQKPALHRYVGDYFASRREDG